MTDQHQVRKATDEEQPGTTLTNPGDEVPAGTPNSGDNICPKCGGSGQLDGRICQNCGGTGVVIEAVSGGA